MRGFFITFLLLIYAVNSFAQDANDYFNESAEFYLKNQSKTAIYHLEKGLEKFPSNKKLKALKNLLDQKEQNQKQKKEDKKNNSEQKNQQPEQENPSESNQQDGINKGEKGEGSSNEQLNRDENQSQRNANDDSGREKSNYNHILKALQQREKEIQQRLLRGKTRAEAKRNEKDW